MRITTVSVFCMGLVFLFDLPPSDAFRLKISMKKVSQYAQVCGILNKKVCGKKTMKTLKTVNSINKIVKRH